MTSSVVKTVCLLFFSNIFMTLAWYGHLKFQGTSLAVAIFCSWLIALPEYALQVPANRIGFQHLTTYQLKILQEVITLIVFMGYAWLIMKEAPTWRTLLSFCLILGAVALTFYKD